MHKRFIKYLAAALMLAASRLTDVRIPAGTVILSAFVGLLVTLAALFLTVSPDYPHTEKVRFEDDDYYYFVKAVPKIKLPEEQAEKGED